MTDDVRQAAERVLAMAAHGSRGPDDACVVVTARMWRDAVAVARAYAAAPRAATDLPAPARRPA